MNSYLDQLRLNIRIMARVAEKDLSFEKRQRGRDAKSERETRAY
jgi:hypothetical protein